MEIDPTLEARKIRDIFATVPSSSTPRFTLGYGVFVLPMVLDFTLPVLRQPACEPVVPGAKALEKNKLLAWLERFSGSSL
ncbi:MAG: hypothetical protein OXT06_11485 [Rhodospirillaceae bacterium]|nr:hypothetical protein [Rhodospirillaceae bacterium]MDD9917524.1 hypothetical protein [Rhodospirillaceae bacterium]MDD9929400.1 hypothetical protein [Rhodospirillaceae bacterium]